MGGGEAVLPLSSSPTLAQEMPTTNSEILPKRSGPWGGPERGSERAWLAFALF